MLRLLCDAASGSTVSAVAASTQIDQAWPARRGQGVVVTVNGAANGRRWEDVWLDR